MIRSTLIFAVCLLSSAAWASTIPAGYISWDVTFPGNSGQFDIVNETGPNSSVFPDTTFPISTLLSLSSLSLTVDFSNGSTTVFGPSYFTLSSDGESFDGSPIAIGGTNPLPIDATLTGTFSPLSITLNDGSTETILSTFSTTILPSGGTTLSDGDAEVINATTGTAAVPEPGTWLLMGIGLGGLAIFSRRDGIRRLLNMFRATEPSRSVTAL